jgi:hypothetical protein
MTIVRHAQPAQPRAQRDAALPAADDQHIGLHAEAQRGCSSSAPLGPGLAARVHAVLGTLDAVRALLLLEALQLDHGGQQRPGRPLIRRRWPGRATAGLEGEPGVGHAVGFGGVAFSCQWPGATSASRACSMARIGGRALLGADVPGEARPGRASSSRRRTAPRRRRCRGAAGLGFFWLSMLTVTVAMFISWGV